jgi:hypothetical protein
VHYDARSIMRELTIVYAPTGAAPRLLGYLKLKEDDTLEWSLSGDISFASSEDVELIEGFSEYLQDSSACMGGMALLEWMESTFSHSIRFQEASRPLSLAAGQALPY